MAQAELDEDSPTAWRLLFAELLRVAQAVHDAHLARSEAEQAGRLAGEARAALEETRARLGSLEVLRDELTEVVEAAEGGRAGERGASRRTRRQLGQDLSSPEHLALTLTTRRQTPKQSPELAR
jgi:hypothetical protein